MAAKVTVAIPVYNGESYIGELLDSILEQSYQDFKVVICDDISIDGTENVVRSFRDDRIEYHKNRERLGSPANFNRTIDFANTAYTYIIHADDKMLPCNLAKKVAVLEDHPNVVMVHSNVYVIDQNGVVLREHYMPHAREDGFEDGMSFFFKTWCGKNTVSACSPLLRTATVQEIGGYDESIRFTSDWEFWMRLALHGDVAYLGDVCACYRLHTTNLSAACYIERGKGNNFLGFSANHKACARVLERCRHMFKYPEVLEQWLRLAYYHKALKRVPFLLQLGEIEEASQHLRFASDEREAVASISMQNTLSSALSSRYLEATIRINLAFAHLLEKGCRRVAIYGCGAFVQKVLSSFRSPPVDIICFVDDAFFEGTRFFGWPAYPLSTAPLAEVDAILLASDYHNHTMKDNLERIGFEGGVINPFC
jgi:glycosyltransferase involved in cell wall biosynthesis